MTNLSHNHVLANSVALSSGSHTHSTNIIHKHTAFNISGGSLNHIALKWGTSIKNWYSCDGSLTTNWNDGMANISAVPMSLSKNSISATMNINTNSTTHTHTKGAPNYNVANRILTSNRDNVHNANLPALDTQNMTSSCSNNSPPFVSLLNLMRTF